ncbi:MAG: hypothetical protein LBD97_03985, partial [Bifidobacteriaceae bacterium]|nr:hypothetical protein [Bifidobacteriaceae bacterium]
MAAHEAGALHAAPQAPAWLDVPADVNALLRVIWPRTARKVDDAVLQVGGIGVDELAALVGTPAYVVDEADFRARAVAFKREFESAFAHLAGARVHYAAKALITVGIARWLAEDGLAVDVCSEGEFEITERGGIPPERVTLHGSNKSDAYLRRALAAGVGRIVVDSLPEIDQITRLAGEAGVVAPVMLRCSIGIEAHTHEFIATSHEDQKFGLSAADGSAFEGVRRVLAAPGLRLLGVHSHIGSQIFDTHAYGQAIRRLVRITAEVERTHKVALPELGLGGGFGVAYTTGHDPLPVDRVARGMAELVERECAAESIVPPH